VIPPGARVWIAMGHTDMRKGMQGLALMVQQSLKRDPHGGDLFVFRGCAGSLVKIIWHDGIGMSLYAKRIEKGRFICARTSPIRVAFHVMTTLVTNVRLRDIAAICSGVRPCLAPIGPE
jgi:transposase